MRSNLLQSCVVGVAFGIVGCSSADDLPNIPPGSTGGSTSVTSVGGSGPALGTGGRTNPTIGGNTSANGGSGNNGNTAAGGTNANGGASTGGKAAGGASVGGSAIGGAANGGKASTGGAAMGGAATGGKAANGGASQGGTSTGGKASTGGAATGGAATGGAATGGAATGGAATGGVATGGKAATGGAATGGAATGGTATGVGGISSTCTEAQRTLTANGSGKHCGYTYEYWKDTGSGSLVLKADGFSVDWSNINNLLGRKGIRPGSGNLVVTYDANYQPNGNSYLCVYGWTRNPLVEYYIVDSWGSWRPPGGTSLGTVQSDGGTYDIYKTQRVQQPSIDGTQTFYQYWSVRTAKRTSGTITVANHFTAWAGKGMNMGSFYEVSMTVEGYQSSGTADVKMSIQ